MRFLTLFSVSILCMQLFFGAVLSPASAEDTRMDHTSPVAAQVNTHAKIHDVPPIIVSAEEELAFQEDDFENMNREVFEFNEAVDGLILAPVAKAYRVALPVWTRDRIGHALENLSAPNDLLNSVFQADVEGGFTAFWRFIINSTLGIGGLHDIASDFGLKPIKKDFGQTLALWGAGEGDFFMLPLLGPATTRDFIGRVVDTITNPFTYLSEPAVITLRVTQIVDDREELLDILTDIREESFDPYATIRSAYKQRRQARIEDAKLRWKGEVSGASPKESTDLVPAVIK